jgi:hypothetical protein
MRRGDTVLSIFWDHAATKKITPVFISPLLDSHPNTIKTAAALSHLCLYIQQNKKCIILLIKTRAHGVEGCVENYVTTDH